MKNKKENWEEEFDKIDTEILWNFDNGKTYYSYELNQIDTFEKVRKGKEVKTTIFALGNGIVKKTTYGKFMGFSRSGKQYVRIKPKGLKTIRTYWIGFWQP